MKKNLILLIALGFFCFFSSGESQNIASDPLPSLPRINCPLYVMEYHVWYRSPFGMGPLPGYVHWGNTEFLDIPTPDDEVIRTFGAIGYPLIGLYHSENPDVIRWQLRCAHNAGIDALFVQLFPDRDEGTYLGGSQVFATILRIASEEGIKIAAHDEVMFRQNWKAQHPDIMAERIGRFLKKFGSDPAYLKIDGHPVYAFQYWTHFMPVESMSSCLDQAQVYAGMPIHFFILGGSEILYQRSSPSSFVVTSNSLFIKEGQNPNIPNSFDWGRLQTAISGITELRSRYPLHHFGLWGYPGFNNLPQRPDLSASASRSFSRQNGSVLALVLQKYQETHPDFILLSSWNDWIENTAIEPGYRFDNPDRSPSTDPYRYCRILAATKGKIFVPPPFPTKESVDPMLWQKLYGIDKLPPRLLSVNKQVPTEVQATWIDSAHEVTESGIMTSGDMWADFSSSSAKAKNISYSPPSSASNSKAEMGYFLTSQTPLRLEINPPATFARITSWYIAMQFTSDTPATLKIHYPALPENIDYREFDRAVFSSQSIVRIQANSSTQFLLKNSCHLLEAAHFTPNALNFLTIEAFPERTGNTLPHILIKRIDLFHHLANWIPGIPSSSAILQSPITFRYPLLHPESPFIFLFACDAEKNWTAPCMIALKSSSSSLSSP